MVATARQLRARAQPQGRLVATVKVRLPSLLATHAGGRREFTVDATTVGAALAAARDAYPAMRRLLDEEDGRRRRHVNVFYNEIDEDSIEDPERRCADGDEILIIQSVSGGASR